MTPDFDIQFGVRIRVDPTFDPWTSNRVTIGGLVQWSRNADAEQQYYIPSRSLS